MKDNIDFNIILEGCDCVGKSSIAFKLIKTIPSLRLIKIDAPKNKKEARKQYTHLISQLNSERGIICDRSFFGERVYAPLMRGYYPNYMDFLEAKLKDHNFLFVITAEDAVIKERFDGDFIKLDQIHGIKMSFINELLKSKVKNKFVLDTSYISSLEAMHQVLDIVKDGSK